MGAAECKRRLKKSQKRKLFEWRERPNSYKHPEMSATYIIQPVALEQVSPKSPHKSLSSTYVT